MLKFGNGIRRPDMVLAAHTVGIFAADVQCVPVDGRVAESQPVSSDRFLGDFGQSGAASGGAGAGEVAGEELVAQAHGIEHLGTAVRLVGRDAHLRHDLEQSLADRLDVAFVGFVLAEFLRQLVAQGGQGIEGQVGIDRLGPVPRQQREMMHLARFAGFHHQADLGAQAGADQMVVHRRSGQQGRNGDMLGIHLPVRNDEDIVAIVDGLLRSRAEGFNRLLHTAGAGIGWIAETQSGGLEGAIGARLDPANLLQVLVAEDGLVRL